MSIVLPMTAILSTWLLIAATFVGLGMGLSQLMGFRCERARDIWLNFWLGFAVTLLLLQIWQLFFRVNLAPAICLSILGSIGLWINRAAVRAVFRSCSGYSLIAAVLVAVWIGNRCIGPAMAYDTGYYHYPTVKWLTSYRIVPGLANLHDRLAFNNSSLLYAAMLDQGFWKTRVCHIANGLLLVVFMAQLASSVCRLLASDRKVSAAELFETVLFIPAVFLALNDGELNIASLSTDVPLIIVLLVLASLLFRQLVDVEAEPASRGFEQFVIAVLLPAAITIKLSSAAFVASALPILGFCWYKNRGSVGHSSIRLIAAAAITLLLLIPWCVRGIILTGYPFYPSTFGAFSYDWRTPTSVCLLQQNEILVLARLYGYSDTVRTGAENAAWIGSWLRCMVQIAKIEIVLPTILICYGIISAVAGRGRNEGSLSRGWLLLIPCIASLAFWMSKAPAPRFGLFVFWTAAATCLSMGFGARIEAARNRKSFVALTCVLTTIVIGVHVLGTAVKSGKREALAVLVHTAGPDHGFYPFPQVAFRSVKTDSGLVLEQPVKGRSFDGPLLTTPCPERTLQLRRPGDLSGGFRATARTNGITG